MSRNAKIILVVAGTLICSCILLCIAGYIALPQLGQQFIGQAQDSTNIKRIASEIADFDLPAGYDGLLGIDILTVKMVMYSPGTTSANVLALVQVAGQNLDRAQTEAQMRQQLEGNGNSSCTGTQVVGQETFNVKGTPTLFVISECNRRGVKMRQEVGTFQGRGGLAIVMGMSPTERWDPSGFRSFVESIR